MKQIGNKLCWAGVLIWFGIFSSVTSLYANETFSIVLLPDTQKYTTYDNLNYIFGNQTQWIADNEDAYNIRYMIHLGDITDDNIASEWAVADSALGILDSADINYTMTLGNHDYWPHNNVFHRNSLYSNYFPTTRFSNSAWNSSYSEKNENTYSTFTYTTNGGQPINFLVMSLEFLPRKDVVSWANDIISLYQDHWVIIVTHSYIDSLGNYTKNNDDYETVGRSGEGLWNELISRHSNIVLALCGHISSVVPQTKTGNNGNTVNELLVDFQSEPLLGIGPANGNGWLYMLEFDLLNNKMSGTAISSEDGNTDIFGDDGPIFYSSNIIGDTVQFETDLNLMELPAYQYTVLTDVFDERTVNTDGNGNQNDPAIAVNALNGNFVVAWEDDSTNNNGVMDVYIRGFDREGNQTFADKQVHIYGSGQQINPSIAMNENGRFVVVWEDDRDSNGYYQIMARIFDESGNVLTGDFDVNSTATGQQRRPAIAIDSNGNFVVVWEDDQDQDGFYDIMARGFDRWGNQIISDFMVNEVQSGQQYKPEIAMSLQGKFVITWEDDNNNNNVYEIMARGFDTAGNETIDGFYVNSVGSGQQYQPDIAMDSNGNFVIVWEDDNDSNGYYEILARGFDSAGNENISDFHVNSVSSGQQYSPKIAMDTIGRFVVSWQDDNDGNGYYEIKARGFNASGSEILADTTVNNISSGQQKIPDIGMDNDSYFFVPWEDDADENGYTQVIVKNMKL
ncbi:MAG: hypothetical protein GY710_05740 [Desulfobacteraceae bacterium]|nr:hypothetical protein [Desulfobacteraceae bacterium]